MEFKKIKDRASPIVGMSNLVDDTLSENQEHIFQTRRLMNSKEVRRNQLDDHHLTNTNDDMIMESPRSARRGTWKPLDHMVFAPTSPQHSSVVQDHSTDEIEEGSQVMVTEKWEQNIHDDRILRTLDDSLMDIAREFSSHVVNASLLNQNGNANKGMKHRHIKGSENPKTATSKRVLCDETRALPTRFVSEPSTPRGSITSRVSATTRMNEKKKQEKSVPPPSTLEKTKSRTKAALTTIAKSTVEYKKTRSVATSDRVPLSARPRLQRNVETETPLVSKRKSLSPQSIDQLSIDPFVISTSPEVVRSKQWLELIMEKKKLAATSSSLNDTQLYKTARLADLESELKSSTDDNLKKIMELQMANNHLKYVEKSIKEFGMMVRSCEVTQDWCSTVEKFLLFYSHTIQNRDKLLQGGKYDEQSCEIDTTSPYISPSNRQMNPQSICITKDGTAVRRTTASIITTKSSRISPKNRSSPPPTISKDHSTLSYTIEASDATISDSAMKPYDSYNCLIEECLIWFAKFLHRHVLYFFEIHDSSPSPIHLRPETRLLQDTVYPWLRNVVKSKFLDQKTIASIVQLADIIQHRLVVHQIISQ